MNDIGKMRPRFGLYPEIAPYRSGRLPSMSAAI